MRALRGTVAPNGLLTEAPAPEGGVDINADLNSRTRLRIGKPYNDVHEGDRLEDIS